MGQGDPDAAYAIIEAIEALGVPFPYLVPFLLAIVIILVYLDKRKNRAK